MKKYCYFIMLILYLPTIAWAQNEEEKGEFYYGLLDGSYDVIGRYPDSNQTYTGKIILIKSGETLEVIRKIKNKVIRGIGKIETASADKIKVLRVRFTEHGKRYEATYLINVDIDNYGRLTGYIYLQDGETKIPGLEALFSDHVNRK